MAQEMDLQYCILRGASSERILEGATGSALRATCVSIQHWVEGNIPIISVPFPALSQSVPQKLQKKCNLESMVTNEEGVVGTPPRGEAEPLRRMRVQAKMSRGFLEVSGMLTANFGHIWLYPRCPLLYIRPPKTLLDSIRCCPVLGQPATQTYRKASTRANGDACSWLLGANGSPLGRGEAMTLRGRRRY